MFHISLLDTTMCTDCSLPHRGVHEIKRTYLASRTHGLHIYNLNTTFISTIYVPKAHVRDTAYDTFSLPVPLFLTLFACTSINPFYLLGNPLLVLWCECSSTFDPSWRYTEPPSPPSPIPPFSLNAPSSSCYMPF
jgi:hypothetical protein